MHKQIFCYLMLLTAVFTSWVESSEIDTATHAGQTLLLDPALQPLAASTKSLRTHTVYPNFDDNTHLTALMRRKIKPHLLPLDHPAKSVLDAIFADTNALADLTAFTKAGFKTVSTKTSSYVRVARHPALPGYLVKVYLCTELRRRGGQPAWQAFVARCKGATAIRQLIRKKHLRHFVVPDKWIYPLPLTSYVTAEKGRRNPHVILVVTDMELASSSENHAAWNKHVTHRQLEELYCILSHGCASTFLTGNIPYTIHGQFACVDTEFSKRKNDYNKVYKYLPVAMRDYWRHLVHRGKHRSTAQ